MKKLLISLIFLLLSVPVYAQGYGGLMVPGSLPPWVLDATNTPTAGQVPSWASTGTFTWVSASSGATGPTGPAGPAGVNGVTPSFGTISANTLPAGSSATATITAENSHPNVYDIALGLPIGSNGANGVSPTITGITATSLAAGSSPTATVTAGTGNTYTITLGIPAGSTGPTGPAGSGATFPIGNGSSSVTSPTSLTITGLTYSASGSDITFAYTLPSRTTSINGQTGAATIVAGTGTSITTTPGTNPTITVSSTGVTYASQITDYTTGNGTSKTFTLSQTPSGSVNGFIGGVAQNPDGSGSSNGYSVSGTTVTFVTAPSSGTSIKFAYIYANGGTATTNVASRRYTMTFFEPSSTGLDATQRLTLPPGTSQSNVNYTLLALRLYTGTPNASATTVQPYYGTSGNAAFGSGTSVTSSAISNTGTSAYLTSTTSFSTTNFATGTPFEINWSAINGTNSTVEMDFQQTTAG